ncbi:hypothetical protein [Bacillus alkalicellulosilyticus]|uniref:hypothetical protein n=1 Tax=Alkalihalobacterium alkalicellulosilyticum TaxID=1912214 RepID=UPI00099605B8|nr:hypothetical protein [Bacillus alkalicellulosilyticus]
MKNGILVLLFVLLFSPLSSTVYAHKLLIEVSEPGTLHVIYEDGSFSTRTVVTVFDQAGNEIDKGTLDDEGYFHYDKVEAHSIVAEDGLGHRTEWTVGEEIVVRSDPHRWLIITIVLTILVGIAIFFSYRTKIKRLGQK